MRSPSPSGRCVLTSVDSLRPPTRRREPRRRVGRGRRATMRCAPRRPRDPHPERRGRRGSRPGVDPRSDGRRTHGEAGSPARSDRSGRGRRRRLPADARTRANRARRAAGRPRRSPGSRRARPGSARIVASGSNAGLRYTGSSAATAATGTRGRTTTTSAGAVTTDSLVATCARGKATARPLPRGTHEAVRQTSFWINVIRTTPADVERVVREPGTGQERRDIGPEPNGIRPCLIHVDLHDVVEGVAEQRPHRIHGDANRRLRRRRRRCEAEREQDDEHGDVPHAVRLLSRSRRSAQ